MKFSQTLDEAYSKYLQKESRLSQEEIAANFLRWHYSKGDSGGWTEPQRISGGRIKYGPYILEIVDKVTENEEDDKEYKQGIAAAAALGAPENVKRVEGTANEILDDVEQRIKKIQ